MIIFGGGGGGHNGSPKPSASKKDMVSNGNDHYLQSKNGLKIIEIDELYRFLWWFRRWRNW